MAIEETLYCRSCGVTNPKGTVDLFGEYKNRSWQEIFHDCTNIDIRKDNFSQIVCKKCMKSLTLAYEFRILTQETHTKLLERSKIKEENHEPEFDHIEAFGLTIIKEDSDDKIQSIKAELTAFNESNYNLDDNTNIKVTKSKPIRRRIKKQITVKEKKWSGVQCPGCRICFKQILDFKKHLKASKGNEEHRWYCEICSASVNTKHDLNGHLMRVHKETTCPKCKEICSGINGVNRHVNSFHKLDEERLKMCPYCGKLVMILRTHIRVVHKREKRFVCDYCDKSFVLKRGLIEHIRIHTNERPYVCSIAGCGKSFKQAGHLKQHETRHGPKQDFICDVCGLNLSSKNSLNEHRKIHFQIGAFKCDECTASFAKPSYLKEHKKNIHTEYIPVICPTCGQTFKNQIRLNFHMKRHEGTDHICKDCNKMFLSRARMMDHISAVHQKIRKYFCKWEGCDKVYLRGEHLRRHERKYHLGNWKTVTKIFNKGIN